MVERLDRLRHHAVVGGHDQHDDVGGLRTTGPHGREGLVAGRVDERDLPPIVVGLIGPDVLGDAAELAADHIRSPDGVQQQRLAVVDVAHDGDHRRPRLQPALVDRLLLFLLLVLLRAHELDLRPSSAATSSTASSESDWVAETISPAENRSFTMSAAVTPESCRQGPGA